MALSNSSRDCSDADAARNTEELIVEDTCCGLSFVGATIVLGVR